MSRLTDRDRTILHLLEAHQVLTTEHLAALAGFPTLDRAQRRLLTLYRSHLLDRFRHPRPDGSMTSWRYALGPAGAAILAAMRGTEPPRPAALRTRLLRLAAHPALNHLLGVNGLFADLARHTATHPGHGLAGWLGERQAARACGNLVRPDGLGVWQHTGGRVVFLLEYDTGTENLAQVQAKLDGYRGLAQSGGPQLPPALTESSRERVASLPVDQSVPQPFWVLFRFHSASREVHLRQRIGVDPALGRPTHGAARWAIATTHAELTEAHSPAGPIWLPLNAFVRHPLQALPPHP
ncbi:replication-relaxation family protein [Crossiella sp. SN42]|uniref:replication-relaxation family protein n=1 Tax=Crossiella sp. SN42 TaxID=2944808 RepID=UPI00207C851E|nr:replication-relaxation family protein [Crossiella sp. SN42]MCO1575203.1 replication-relaxation family protein [Crossiella sp. SN42]